ncbi:MAG: metal-dependent transcriptional regulator [Fimbriimonadaceae bacterium]|nr:metal-dependent transcriptional regulator [Fimbriimonadaceae bacterium]
MAKPDVTLRVPASCRPRMEDQRQRALSESVEEYVEGIYRLQREVDRVSTGEIAVYMQVSPGSASSMVKRLAEMDLVEHTPYYGIRLTAFGEKVAKQLTRAHRILERFLVDDLGLPWNDVHELACKLEHYLSEDVIDRIDAKMGHPKTCPHGNPVDADAPDPSVRLEAAPAGLLTVFRISDERVEFLRRLEELNLRPGVTFNATGSTAVDQLIHIEVQGQRHTVGHEVARHVWVVPAENSEQNP